MDEVSAMGSHSFVSMKGMVTSLLGVTKKMALTVPSWYIGTIGNKLSAEFGIWPLAAVFKNQWKPMPSKQEPLLKPALMTPSSVTGKVLLVPVGLTISTFPMGSGS